MRPSIWPQQPALFLNERASIWWLTSFHCCQIVHGRRQVLPFLHWKLFWCALLALAQTKLFRLDWLIDTEFFLGVSSQSYNAHLDSERRSHKRRRRQRRAWCVIYFALLTLIRRQRVRCSRQLPGVSNWFRLMQIGRNNIYDGNADETLADPTNPGIFKP
jgi:hypothetical protein